MNADPSSRYESPKPSSPALMLRLALADLWHEWILTACLMLAICAVIAPLLLLFGLKYGTIETLRHRLIQDPKNREVRPLSSVSHPKEWFETMQSDPRVAFVTPMTRQIAASVAMWVKDSGPEGKQDLDLIPTGEGDPLVLENGAPVPSSEECVLTEFAAEAIGAVVGDTLIMEASRMRGSRRETGTTELKVTGVVSRRASAIKAVFVPLALLEDVESFKDGLGIPALNWPGDKPLAYPLYDGVVVSTATPLPTLLQSRLRANTGFTRIASPAATALANALGYTIPETQSNLLLSTELRPLADSSITAVETQIRGYGAALLPWVRDLQCTIQLQGSEDSKPVRIVSLPGDGKRIGILPEPPWSEAVDEPESSISALIHPDHTQDAGTAQLTLSQTDQPLSIPIRLIPTAGVPADTIMVPSRTAGILRLATTRPLAYDTSNGHFLLSRRGYAGFRLYARALEDVDELRRSFENKGIPVHTEAQRIQTVIEMDRYLTLIFWLIATVGIGGSMASLVASLYASVERKKRELSVLRLLGLSGPKLFRFPLIQGAVIAGGAYLLAWGFFATMAAVINHLFRNHLQSGESFCTLPLSTALLAGAIILGLACLAATAALVRLARIDPAEALRDE
ncbi:MAG: ABC transporter permease [Opitutales bacterium]|nr:ABC transporter permease [Opitutales bacterium]